MVVHCHGAQVAAGHLHEAQRIGKGCGLGDDDITGIDVSVGGERDALHRARGQDDAERAQLLALGALDAVSDFLAQALEAEDEFFIASGRVEIVEHLGAMLVQRLAGETNEVVGWEGLGCCQALVEIEDRRHFGVREEQGRAGARELGAQMIDRHGFLLGDCSQLVLVSGTKVPEMTGVSGTKVPEVIGLSRLRRLSERASVPRKAVQRSRQLAARPDRTTRSAP